MIAASRPPEPRSTRGKRIRALVIDDSILDRRTLSEILSADDVIEVAAVAATGAIGLQRIAQDAPDIVLLDATMHDQSTVETVRAIRASWPRLPILIACARSDRDAARLALQSGASDYVAKPERRSVAIDRARCAADIVSKVRALAAPPTSAPPVALARRTPGPVSTVPLALGPVTALAIGASTGGPNALSRVFASLPHDLPVPVFIVQHMPPMFTKSLAARLTASSGFDVVEAADGDVVTAGRAYIAPGDFHMTVAREASAMGEVRIALNQEPPERSCRPAVDVLFRSVAAVYGAGALAAVLTGMGHDGTLGARQIADVGGTVIVQDSATSVVATMPASVAAAVGVDGVYPIDAIASELVARVRRRAALLRQRGPGTP